MSRNETSFNAEPPHKDTSFLGMTTAVLVIFNRYAARGIEFSGLQPLPRDCHAELVEAPCPRDVMSRNETSFNAEPPHKDTSFLGITTAVLVIFNRYAVHKMKNSHSQPPHPLLNPPFKKAKSPQINVQIPNQHI